MKGQNHIPEGEKRGHLKVLYRGKREHGHGYFYHCECDCGSIVDVEASALEHGKQSSCLCKGKYLEIDRKYGHLTVRKRLKRGVYDCDCDCGKRHVVVQTSDVLNGVVCSCGCSRKPYNRKVRKDSSTQIRGVTWNKKDERYRAYIYQKGKNRYLGSFIRKEDAVRAREHAEMELREQMEAKP